MRFFLTDEVALALLLFAVVPCMAMMIHTHW